MTSITNSSIPEDLYIAHLAGIQAGKNVIEYSDKSKAYSAQKHPISNTISAGIRGTVDGIGITTMGLLAYPLINNSMRSSIIGSKWNVCSACVFNFQSITEKFFNILKIVDPKETISYWDLKAGTYLYGGVAGAKCAVENKFLNGCRAVNFAGGVINTLSDNYKIIGAATAGLIAMSAFYQMYSYGAQECQAEEEVKKVLTEKFGKIATRLTTLEGNQKAQECAKNILQRRMEINKEIESLQLPNLTWKDIEQITQPMFDAAKKLQQN